MVYRTREILFGPLIGPLIGPLPPVLWLFYLVSCLTSFQEEGINKTWACLTTSELNTNLAKRIYQFPDNFFHYRMIGRKQSLQGNRIVQYRVVFSAKLRIYHVLDSCFQLLHQTKNFPIYAWCFLHLLR